MSEWKPIETAPSDGQRIQLVRGGRYDIGRFDDERYIRKPKPYWASYLNHYLGVRWARDNYPTHWMPIPDLPAEDDE